MKKKPDLFRLRNIILSILAVIGLTFGWAGWTAYTLITAEPVISVDYAQRMVDLSAESQPGTGNAWPLIKSMCELVNLPLDDDWDEEEEWRGEVDPTRPFELSALDEPVEPYDWSEIRDWSRVLSGPFEPERHVVEYRELSMLREAGVFDLLSEAVSIGRLVLPPLERDSPGDPLFFSALPLQSLSGFREFNDALCARMRIALHSNDDAEFEEALRSSIGFISMLWHQPGLIYRRNAITILIRTLRELRYEAIDGEINAGQCRLVIQILKNDLRMAPIELVIESERMNLLDAIQCFHTDNGRGGGYFLPNNWREFDEMIVGGSSAAFNPGSILAETNLSGVLFPRRRTTVRLCNAWFDDLLAEVEKGPTEFAKSCARRFSATRAQTAKNPIGSALIPYLDDHIGIDFSVPTLVEGTRLILALRIHAIEQGHYPDSLDELVPEILPSVPSDPLHGQPFVYRVDESESVADGRETYLLYSVGIDETDNGGRSAADRGPDDPRLRKWDPLYLPLAKGFDFILSDHRPEYVEP